jgi:hypothetical protein
MEEGPINEDRVEQVYGMKESACITRNRSVWAAVGKRIAASRCFPSLVPFGSL